MAPQCFFLAPFLYLEGGLPSPFHSLCVNNVLSTFFFPPLARSGWVGPHTVVV